MVSCLAALLAAPAFGAPPAIYEAPWDASEWRVATSRAECALEHTIPGFGRARFQRRSGEALTFRLAAVHPLSAEVAADWFALPPPWKRGALPTLDQSVRLGAGPRTYATRDAWALRLYRALEGGLSPALHAAQTPAAPGGWIVALSPVRFRAAQAAFEDCIAGLLPYGYDAVAETRVRFAPRATRLDEDARRVLVRVAEYLRVDPEVTGVTVEGYADDRGPRQTNREISRRRAEAVREFLKGQGVAGDRVRVVARGEAQPLASNRTAQGRAENRTAIVTLERASGDG